VKESEQAGFAGSVRTDDPEVRSNREHILEPGIQYENARKPQRLLRHIHILGETRPEFLKQNRCTVAWRDPCRQAHSFEQARIQPRRNHLLATVLKTIVDLGLSVLPEQDSNLARID
jgi:hypothetical protein